MLLRKFSRDALESEPHGVLFADVYPWDAIDDTPFGSSLALIQPSGRTMLHSHDPAETFFICRGSGTITIDGKSEPVGPGDVIYLPPGSVHELRNDSATDELVFVSVFWKARVRSRLGGTPRAIMPSPPTPNGGLHLGHLAGPYLLADALRRYLRARGMIARTLCATDDHQSFVADRAATEGHAPSEFAARCGRDIAEAMTAFDAKPDVTLATSRDDDYRAAVRARWDQLVANGQLVLRPTTTLHCARCQLALFDSYAAGHCPHCGEPAYGTLCERCHQPFDSGQLVDPRCDRCGDPAEAQTTERFVFAVEPYRDRLAEYHRGLRLAPKLRRLAALWLADRPPAIVASQLAEWGISVGEHARGQIISPWFELALASSYLRDRCAPGAEVTCCFGYDNAYLYLIQDPAVTLALDSAAQLPVELWANEFLALDDHKMSTSRAHAIDARSVLMTLPADLLRLYLAKVRPESTRTNANPAIAQMFLAGVTRVWQAWLTRLGDAIIDEADGVAPAAANPSLVPWSHEQQQFLTLLDSFVDRARVGYESGTLQEAATVVYELVERATAFGAAQAHLIGIAALAGERATGLALELAAARVLAMIAAPILPSFALHLWRALGEAGDVVWADDVGPIPAGQPIALAGRQFFPSEIAWPTSS